jgi:hypothetical protein
MTFLNAKDIGGVGTHLAISQCQQGMQQPIRLTEKIDDPYGTNTIKNRQGEDFEKDLRLVCENHVSGRRRHIPWDLPSVRGTGPVRLPGFEERGVQEKRHGRNQWFPALPVRSIAAPPPWRGMAMRCQRGLAARG